MMDLTVHVVHVDLGAERAAQLPRVPGETDEGRVCRNCFDSKSVGGQPRRYALDVLWPRAKSHAKLLRSHPSVIRSAAGSVCVVQELFKRSLAIGRTCHHE